MDLALDIQVKGVTHPIDPGRRAVGDGDDPARGHWPIRSLVFDRGIAAIVVMCLALGIGINATLFSVIDGVLIH